LNRRRCGGEFNGAGCGTAIAIKGIAVIALLLPFQNAVAAHRDDLRGRGRSGVFRCADGRAAVAINHIPVITLLGRSPDPVATDGTADGGRTDAGEPALQSAERRAAVAIDEILVVAFFILLGKTIPANRKRDILGTACAGDGQGRGTECRKESETETAAVTDLSRGTEHAHFALLAIIENGVSAAGRRRHEGGGSGGE